MSISAAKPMASVSSVAAPVTAPSPGAAAARAMTSIATGTGFATPIVSAVTAALLGVYPKMGALDTKRILISSAEAVSLPTLDPKTAANTWLNEATSQAELEFGTVVAM